MPLYLQETLAHQSTLGIWKITEPLAFFSEHVKLSTEERQYLDKFTNTNRKCEFYAVRALLQALSKEDLQIHYHKTGKPGLQSDLNISISHTKGFACILLSTDKEVGIDMEYLSDRVLRIKNKFLDSEEQSWCHSTDQHILAWSAKESIFKLYGKGLDFKDIHLRKFNADCNDSTIEASLKCADLKNYTLYYKKIEDNYLTYVFK